MATPSSAWTGEKPRKAGNGAGRGSAARSGEKVVPISPTGSAQDVHRTPPHSVEAEQGVLGSMLISPHETIAECVEKINEEYFYVPAHRTIYDILVELWNAGQAIDLITFTQVLRDRNLLDSVFFFQAEDGIRAGRVTGVQTCALPILGRVLNAVRAHSPIALAIQLSHAGA